MGIGRCIRGKRQANARQLEQVGCLLRRDADMSEYRVSQLRETKGADRRSGWLLGNDVEIRGRDGNLRLLCYSKNIGVSLWPRASEWVDDGGKSKLKAAPSITWCPL